MLAAKFAGLAKTLTENQSKINGELLGAQGKPVDLGGYSFDDKKTFAALRPKPPRTTRSPRHPAPGSPPASAS